MNCPTVVPLYGINILIKEKNDHLGDGSRDYIYDRRDIATELERNC